TVRVSLQIDKFHHDLGGPEDASIDGHGTNVTANVVATPYTGVLTSIAPATVFAGQEVVISGQAVDRNTQTPMPNTQLQIALRLMGYERLISVFTDQTGSFTYRFTPQSAEAGRYSVSVIYPGSSERLEQGIFTVDSIGITPQRYDVRVPRNYQADLQFTVST